MWAVSAIMRSRSAVSCADRAPFSARAALVSPKSELASIKSITASASFKLVFPFKKARRVNSPGSASLAPAFSRCFNIWFAAKKPP